MKIFLSYGHDSNAPLIEKIKEYLSKDADRNLKHEVRSGIRQDNNYTIKYGATYITRRNSENHHQ